jgi:hypothetical protein
MKPHLTNSLYLCAIALAFASIGAEQSALAQALTPGRSVLIVVPDEFATRDARAVIIRNPSQEDVIALDKNNLTPDGLVAALSLLQELRSVSLPANASTGVVVITGSVPPDAPNPATSRKAAALLAELLSRSTVNVGNLGRGRWLRLAELRLGD